MSAVALRAKSAFVFAGHQILGTWGVACLANLGLTFFFDMMSNLGIWNSSMHFAHWLLTENPFYPLQIAAGMILGWQLGRRFRHKPMLWTWILPLAILCYALIAAPVLIPEWTSILARPITVGSRLSYYFGWGCQAQTHCLDQLVITMPFYASVAYSLGALLARLLSPTTPIVRSLHTDL